MAEIYLIPQQQMNRTVSHIRGVRDSVHDQAKVIKSRAVLNHQTSHDPDDEHETEFSVTRGDVDSFANMDHRAPIPYEFGWVTKNGKVVPGSYVLTRAMLGL